MGPWDPGIHDPEEVRKCRRFKAQRVNETASRANEAASRANEAASRANQAASKDIEQPQKTRGSNKIFVEASEAGIIYF